MPRNTFVPGDYNVICDECGFKFKKSQTRMRWDNMLVCEKDWEPRQSQDFVRGVPDKQTVPIARPEAEDVFITTPVTAEDL